MVAPPRVRRGRLGRRERLVGIAEHPQVLRPVDALAGHGIGVGELRDMPVGLGVVALQQRIAIAPRRLELAEPVGRPRHRAVPDDLERVVVRRRRGLEEARGPEHRRVETVGAHVVDPERVQDRQVAGAVVELAGERPRRLEHGRELRVAPAALGDERRAERGAEAQLGEVALAPRRHGLRAPAGRGAGG